MNSQNLFIPSLKSLIDYCNNTVIIMLKNYIACLVECTTAEVEAKCEVTPFLANSVCLDGPLTRIYLDLMIVRL